MRGVNLGGWFSQVDAIAEKDPAGFTDLLTHIESFLTPLDFERVKTWGFDHVRLPLDYFNAFDGTELQPVESVLRLLDRAIDQISAVGLDVILDLHKCPGHDFHAGCDHAQEFFSNPSKRDEAKRVWQHLALRYAHRKNVLFEILNEPVAEDSSAWDAVKDEMAAHIRRHAPSSTLVVGSNRWNNPGEFSRLTPLRDDNVLYSFHFYSPILFTHQQAPWLQGEVFRRRRSYPGEYSVPEGTQHRLPLETGRWDRDAMQEMLEPVIRFRKLHRVEIACNEFGVYVGGADRESQLRWMQDFISILLEHGIGYSYWNYKNLDFGLVSSGERAFADFPQYQNTDRIDSAIVEILTKTRNVSGIVPSACESAPTGATAQR
jgi:endoglucanase